MDQVVQLQQQLQRLQQEISGISQVCNQLQQSEQTNAIQLQQMTQKEFLASQGLRRIQQAANQLSQEVNQISNITSQIVSQVLPVQRALQTTGVIPGTYALTSQIPGTGVYGGQFGTFGQGTAQMTQFPGLNLSAVSSQLPLYTQGYSANAFGTGSQMGMGSQALSNVGTSQFQQQPWGTNIYSQGLQNAGLGATQQWGQQSNVSGTGIGYSPYQANQFGFR